MVIALMRARLVREVAQEQADVIGQAVEAERETGLPVAARDARAVANLAYALPLWEDEIVAVVRRERRRLAQEALVAQLDAVRVATAATAPALRASLAAEDLDPAEVSAAMAAAAQPGPGWCPRTSRTAGAGPRSGHRIRSRRSPASR